MATANNQFNYLSSMLKTDPNMGNRIWAINQLHNNSQAPASAPAAVPPVAAPATGTPQTFQDYIKLFNANKSATAAAPAPAAYTPDPTPATMDWETALTRAKQTVNPQYDTLRQKAEVSYRDQREEIPQLLAARYGMSGIRGGRRASSESDLTQNESMGINELESQRNQATNSLATSLQDDSYSKAMDLWKAQQSLKAAQAQDEYNRYRNSILDKQSSDSTDTNLLLKALEFAKSDEATAVEGERWDKTFDYNKETDDRTQANADRAYNWETDPNTWKNSLAIRGEEASLAKALSGGSGSGGSGGSSSGGKTTEAEKTRQANQAAIDWIGKYQSQFTGKYPAKNMYEQVKRNMVAGTINATLGNAILLQLKKNFME